MSNLNIKVDLLDYKNEIYATCEVNASNPSLNIEFFEVEESYKNYIIAQEEFNTIIEKANKIKEVKEMFQIFINKMSKLFGIDFNSFLNIKQNGLDLISDFVTKFKNEIEKANEEKSKYLVD